jgi:outer membrane protein assembly factor BamB
MTFMRPSRSDNHLSNYWNALVRNAPAEELARLARLVEPSDIAAIERTHAAHERHQPDPVFARRLEQTLMDMATSPIEGTIPQIHVSPPFRNGSRDPGPVPRRRSAAPPHARWTLRPAFAIALVILLVLASVGGVWWTLTNNRDDEPHRLLAPEVATPSPESSPGWSHFKGDSARRGETNAGPVYQPVELWRHQVNAPCIPAPAVVGDTVYAACDDATLYALDAATGAVRWDFTAEPAVPFIDGTAISGNLVYMIGGDEALYAVDINTGELIWRYDTTPIMLSPAVDGGLLVTGTRDGYLIGIDAATGEEQWRYQVTKNGATRVPALLNGVAYVGSETGDFTAIDVTTGEVRWSVDTGESATGTAVIADGIAYIGTSADAETGTLAAYDANTGELLWRRTEPMHSPSVSNGIGYSGSGGGIVYAFDTATGEELWRFQVGGVARPLAIAGDIVYVPSDGDRAIYAVDSATGEELWHVDVDGNIDSQAAVADGRIYVATMSGVIHAFGEGSPSAVPAAADASPDASPIIGHGATPGATPTAASDVALEAEWQSTGGPDPLLFPTGVEVAPDGTIWVVDSANNRFQLLTPDGEYIETWGIAGDGEGEFNFNRSPGDPGNSVADIAFAPDSSFYVTDSANRRVQHFAADRTFIDTWGTFGTSDGQFLDPFGVAVAPDGNVYVIDDQRDDIQVFDPEGTYLFTISEHGTGRDQLNGTGSLTFGRDGTVYVADFGNHRVKQFAADGTFIMAFGEPGGESGQLTNPTDIVVDREGNVYVTEPEMGRVQVFTLSGDFLGIWSPTEDQGAEPFVPLGIALDSDGSVYVTDVVGGNVVKLHVTKLGLPEATPEA